MFSRLLIANRGEIACRVIRCCRKMGIHSIAVYSDADANARHVREADSTVRIGPAPARESYLDARAIVQAAIACAAEAIHPGYGFLSEKLELIDACNEAGIVFVGPHREAIARMGSKIESKRLARAAGMACVPGYDGDDQSDARLCAEAERLGYPLLIKASAGGGGKGLRRVDGQDEFAMQLATARAEARAAFGDDRVLLELCLARPRHLEVQILGDKHGGLVHLFERECSIQRNYQKVIEEAPANHLSDTVRNKLYSAALALSRAIGYDSAGTVEFVLDAAQGDEPYFLEMNTRLQVEHPVTELTTGIDLVECQILSALGQPLAFTQENIRRHGWALEARINAEVPDKDYQGSFGPVLAYAEPQQAGVRVDSGIDANSEITPHYDSMLAKLIAVGSTRAAALDRLRLGLRELRIEGVQTNQAWLAAILDLPAFGEVLTTGFLNNAFPHGWRPTTERVDERNGAAAAAWYFAEAARFHSERPLDAANSWRLTAPAGRLASFSLQIADSDGACDIVLTCMDAQRVEYQSDGRCFSYLCGEPGRVYSAARCFDFRRDGDDVLLWCEGQWSSYQVRSALRARTVTATVGAGQDAVLAQLPGIVTALLVEVGQTVTAGMPVVVLEAMKLVHTLCAPRDGVIASIGVAVGDTIQGGALLVRLEPPRDEVTASVVPPDYPN